MLMSIVIFVAAALALGVLLGYAGIRLQVKGDPMVERIDALLPQTQCGQCGYAGCKPYAKAIASGEADINQCPPGGEPGMVALAELMGCEPKPLGENLLAQNHSESKVALIAGETCIGCTKCIQVCPVDAIEGAAKQIHTVVAEFCTGCQLCLPPVCPVDDCITLEEVRPTASLWKWPRPQSVHQYVHQSVSGSR
jgi:electron transport complex protein RnfB